MQNLIKESFNKLKNDFNNSKDLDLYKFYVLLIYGFNRMIRFNSSGRYNLPVGNVDFNKNVVEALGNYFTKVNSENINWSKNYNVMPINSNYISYHDNSIKRFNEVLVTNYDTN